MSNFVHKPNPRTEIVIRRMEKSNAKSEMLSGLIREILLDTAKAYELRKIEIKKRKNDRRFQSHSQELRRLIKTEVYVPPKTFFAYMRRAYNEPIFES